jgi:hypothetical protein
MVSLPLREVKQLMSWYVYICTNPFTDFYSIAYSVLVLLFLAKCVTRLLTAMFFFYVCIIEWGCKGFKDWTIIDSCSLNVNWKMFRSGAMFWCWYKNVNSGTTIVFPPLHYFTASKHEVFECKFLAFSVCSMVTRLFFSHADSLESRLALFYLFSLLSLCRCRSRFCFSQLL